MHTLLTTDGASLFALPFPLAQTTIADIQSKVLAKMENKFKGGASSMRLKRMLSDVDGDKDGHITFREFQAGLGELCLAPDESAFLFQFCKRAEHDCAYLAHGRARAAFPPLPCPCSPRSSRS